MRLHPVQTVLANFRHPLRGTIHFIQAKTAVTINQQDSEHSVQQNCSGV